MARTPFSLLLVFTLGIHPLSALTLEESPLSPGQERQADALFGELRCAVCQGQSVRDSNAQLAVDLRQAVRQHLQQGRSIAEIKSLMVESYGPEILLQEPVSPRTGPLWMMVAAVAVLALTMAVRPFLLRKTR